MRSRTTCELPLAASWHTNVHEYAARRSDWFLRLLPKRQSAATGQTIEDLAMATAARFYSVAQVLFAPNPELCALLERNTGRPCHLMPRGVDAELFHPRNANAIAEDRDPVLGFVGRLSVEKNIGAARPDPARSSTEGPAKSSDFSLSATAATKLGCASDLPQAEFTGVLRGEELAAAYANMDLFVFPSHTDTFGNVVLEALASGVPAIVTPDGGPSTIVRDGVTGPHRAGRSIRGGDH